MKRTAYRKCTRLICCIFISLFIVTCAEQFSTEFDTEKSYNISGDDNDACLLLTSALLADTTIVGTDTTISPLNYIPVFVTEIDSTINAAWVNAHDTLIQALYDTLLSDKIIILNNPKNNTVAYTLFEKDNSETDTYFYVSWDLNVANLDAYITLDVFNKSGEKIQLYADEIALETIAGCTEEVELVGSSGVFPKIRARFHYKLSDGLFLLRFSNTAPADMNNVRVVIF